MGKAFTTAVRWLAPLGAILTPRRTHAATLNDAHLGATTPKPTSQRVELASGALQASQNLVGIAIQQPSPPPPWRPTQTGRLRRQATMGTRRPQHPICGLFACCGSGRAPPTPDKPVDW